MSEAADIDTPAAPGQRLAEARQAQNLAPADVARQLKLSVWQVEALEAGNYAQLPGAIFVRGFIRNYARLVRLDPNELLRAAAGALPQEAPRPESPASHEIPFPAKSGPRWPIFAAVAAVMLVVLVVYEFYWDEPEPRVVAARPAKTDAAPVVAAQAAATPAEASVVAVQAEPVKAAPQPGDDAPTPTAGEADTERQLKRGERRVRLAFEQESWVEIRDRNERVIFSQLNRPGTQQLVQGVPPFSVVVGNAQGVRLTYDERQVDLAPHTKIDVARLILE